MSPRSAQHSKKSKKTRGGGFAARRSGRGVARYYQLYEFLSNALNDGTIPAGSVLPSEPDLVTRYKLSRTTVRRALARLEAEGRIVRRRGSGTYARQSREPQRLYLNLDTFYADVPTLADQTSASILRFETAPVPPSLREQQPEVGSHALLIQRLQRQHGTPYALTTAYVPEAIGRKIRRSALSRASLLTLLDHIGPRTTRTETTTTAVAADAVAAKRLAVALGTPLLRMRATLWDSQGQLRAIHETLCRPDRLHVRAALERNSGRGPSPQWRLRT
jgi:GntR family transcriptional regulator